MTDVKRVTVELRVQGPNDTPRERFCAHLFSEVLQEVQKKVGAIPRGMVLAFQWGEEPTKVYIGAVNEEAFKDVAAGTVQFLWGEDEEPPAERPTEQ